MSLKQKKIKQELDGSKKAKDAVCFNLQRYIYLRSYKEMNTKTKFHNSSHAQMCHRIRNINESILQHLLTNLLQPICAQSNGNVV